MIHILSLIFLSFKLLPIQPYKINPINRIDHQNFNQPESIWAINNLKTIDLSLELNAKSYIIPTSFCQSMDQDKVLTNGKIKTILFLHGTDSSCLEWRFLMNKLDKHNLNCVSLDWWSGGWTERKTISNLLIKNKNLQPWDLISLHINTFCTSYLKQNKIILVGTSLGGSIALDFSSKYPELIDKLILINSGGISYKSPPPYIVSKLSYLVVSIKFIFQRLLMLLPDEKNRILSIHRGEPYYFYASLLYFLSGGIENRVNINLIKNINISSYIIWGSNDQILPLNDAYTFRKILPDCHDVIEVPNSGHSPHLDNPEFLYHYFLFLYKNNSL